MVYSSLFFFIIVFSIWSAVNNVQYKFCQDSNRRPLVSEVTALPTEPNHCPKPQIVHN